MAFDTDALIQQLTTFVRTDLMERADYPLHPDEPLITSGLLDSFSLARVAVYIEEELAVYLPDSELTVENMDTVKQMVSQIEQWSDKE